MKKFLNNLFDFIEPITGLLQLFLFIVAFYFAIMLFDIFNRDKPIKELGKQIRQLKQDFYEGFNDSTSTKHGN